MHHRDFASEKWSHKVRCIWVRWCVTWGIDWKENPENVKLCFKGLAKNGKYQTSQCVILLTQSFIKVLSLIKYSSGSVTFHLILFFLSNLRSFLTQILFFVVFSLVTRRPPSVTRKALLWQSCPQSGREKGMVSDSLWKISLFSCLFFFFLLLWQSKPRHHWIQRASCLHKDRDGALRLNPALSGLVNLASFSSPF